MASTEASKIPHISLRLVRSDQFDDISGLHFDHLVMGPEIGRGGMATVCRAQDLRLGRTVAVKLLSHSSVLDQQAVERFQREMQITAALDHPHIVPMFAKGEVDGVPFFEMPLISGRSLNEVLSALRDRCNGGEPLAAESLRRLAHCKPTDDSNRIEATVSPPTSWTISFDYFREVARLLVQAASALAYVHDHGFVHSDVKPANILLDADGHVWLIDFSAAHAQGGPAAFGKVAAAGTLAYLPPELLEDNATPTPLCDVYGLGATLYELTTLRPPFSADNGQSLMRQIVFDAPLAPRCVNRHIPRELEAITQRAMALRTEDRFTSIEEMRSALQKWLDISTNSTPLLRRSNGFRSLRQIFIRHRWQPARACILSGTIILALLIMIVIGRGINRGGTASGLVGGRDSGIGVRTAIQPSAAKSTKVEIADRTMHVFRGHFYRLTSRPGNWADAEQEAIASRGHLVAIADQAEQEFLNATFLKKQSDGQHSVCWIGLRCMEESSEYRWSSGEAVNYTNWHPGEPNNFAGTERYAAANWHLATESIGDERQGDWNDVPLDGSIYGIIEIPSEQISSR